MQCVEIISLGALVGKIKGKGMRTSEQRKACYRKGKTAGDNASRRPLLPGGKGWMQILAVATPNPSIPRCAAVGDGLRHNL
jgi:hypothetical protein